jgi:hypothetical protein
MENEFLITLLILGLGAATCVVVIAFIVVMLEIASERRQ